MTSQSGPQMTGEGPPGQADQRRPAPTGNSAAVEIHTEELRERISWLIRLRWAAAVGVVVTVYAVPKVLGVRLAQVPLHEITAALAIYNFVLWVMSRRLPFATKPVALTAFANAQIGVDLLFLTALLHYAGGIENPFVCYYVFHVVIASILLSRRATYVHVTIALGLLTSMAGLEATGHLRHYHLTRLIGPELFRSRIYVLAILSVVGTMLYFTAFMATSITARLRRRESEVDRLSRSLQEHTTDLERAYETLSRLDKSKSDYLHRVAHHLRSPLAAVERTLAVVSEGRTGPVSGKSREMIERARERVRNALGLARDLLALSRAREMTPFVARKQVNLAEIVASVEHDLAYQAASASVSLNCSIDPLAAAIAGDPESMTELFENLVSNAVKYTPPGGQVRVAVVRKGSQVEISVADTGIGIPTEETGLVFDEFYRASNARETGKEGTGLGLSIVQAIARAHGGQVSVESEVGKGTTFRVVLPLSPADPAPAAPAPGQAAPSAELRPADDVS